VKYEASTWKTGTCLASFCSYSARYACRACWGKTSICWPNFQGVLTKRKWGYIEKEQKYPYMLARFLGHVDQIW